MSIPEKVKNQIWRIGSPVFNEEGHIIGYVKALLEYKDGIGLPGNLLQMCSTVHTA